MDHRRQNKERRNFQTDEERSPLLNKLKETERERKRIKLINIYKIKKNNQLYC